ncbi:putative P-loop containing nucleoside triphosphate hydrolase, leucine-rich repeat domain, L [Medicago truncatula]|uniref:LRR and NB-ARC domain disease resistance protein n=1 Tax=Medicago truncatula TaxID=3880 RepID=G7IX03_MEDTR|nr:putative disease resistance RPP13-like protein 1 [Medicago truncatula]AES69619.2 LRR and NB-ARC domain disease resistance protein [Medicago truncatula]RHN66316.1 putative P-loop containing nucleoside triphosphate hydrolase, leucine-rich repeat domain, L [Medicago truncatula]
MAAVLIGGAFLAATLQTLTDKLASIEFRDYITKTELNESLIDEMETSLLTLEVVLDDAEEKQILKPRIKQWLDRLKDAIYDAEDLFNQISYNALRCKMEKKQAINSEMDQNITDQFRNLLSTTNSNEEINSEMKKIYKRLQTFVQQSTAIGLQHTVSGRVSHRLPSSSVVNESVMVGRKDDKETIMNMLLSQRDTTHNAIGVVAILGMGGLGKTTLAQLVYNDKEVQQHFDMRAWACVSEDFDIMRVTKSLLESVTSTTWDSNNLDVLRVELKKHSREKRFLFVLDDLWNDSYDDWDELVSPFIDGKPGSMVIITTRQEKVAEVAHTFPIHELKLLSNEDCWSLLSKHALRVGEFHRTRNSTFEEIGRKIARKCGGLPIAAKTIGGLLGSKVDIIEWTTILNSNVWNLPNDKILPTLHLSYQCLPSHLKICFAYCSIFPKGHTHDRKKLVLLWMAEGFLDYSHGEKTMEELGDDCFAELLSRSLIQQSNDNGRGEKFFMHDLVNDLATVVSGKSCCRFECGNISENVRHVSYIQEEYDIVTKFKPFHNLKCLRTFLPIHVWRCNNYLSFKVVDDLIPSLKRLRVLSLSKYKNITKLPDTIGKLVQLRYLDLSFTEIESLPDATCNLYNLQTLILSSCEGLTKLPVHIGNLVQLQYLDLSFTEIESLPDATCNLYNLKTLILSSCESLTELPLHIGNLVSLRHLDISETNISKLPMEMLKLTNLQTLTLFLVGKPYVGLSIKELSRFTNLRRKLIIKNLENIVDATEACDANLKSKDQIEELEMIWGKQSEDSQKVKVLLDMLQPPINLKSLNICLYGGTSFSSWLGNSSFCNLVSLVITDCEYCAILPPLGQLPSLKDLEIFGMKMLETIGPEFYYVQIEEGSESFFQPFPSLERIKFNNMPNWNQWLPFEGINFVFPRLRTMELDDCPELKGHLPSDLPCIEEIMIKGCANLLDTPPTLDWLPSVKKININGLGSDASSMMFPFYSLQKLTIDGFSSPMSFPIGSLPNTLKFLIISNCENLEFLPHEYLDNSTYLEELTISYSCNSMISFTLGSLPILKSMFFEGCKNLKSISIAEDASEKSLSFLRSIKIWDCNELESFPSGGLATPNLVYIALWKCEKLHSLPEAMTDLTGLKEMEIDNLPNVQSFVIDDLPSSLQELTVGSVGGIMWKTEPTWEHLTCLSVLRISGNDMVNSLMASLLPASLLRLRVCGLTDTNLDGKWFLHLSSLRNLEIVNAPKLESLPNEGLPTSISVLSLTRCPLLEAGLQSKQGKEWHKILHIPAIIIDDKLIT